MSKLTENNTSSNAVPFIIWTLQRTGGTNLSQRLIERSSLSGTQHEPFNKGRIFGHITERWIKYEDVGALSESVKQIAEKKILIKHCVEMVPWEITQALAHATCNAGYSHLFLYRRQPLGRLLSLQFANLSGIWGPELKDKNQLDEKIFSIPLPVAKLTGHEKRCSVLLSNTWDYLKALGAQPMAFAYEDIFQSDDPAKPAEEILPILSILGLSHGEQSDLAFVQETVGKGDQGTRDKYSDFIDIDRLESALTNVPHFAPNIRKYNLKLTSFAQGSPWVVHSQIDIAPTQVLPDQIFAIGGVVVITGVLQEGDTLRLVNLDDGIEACQVTWGIKSKLMAKQYPQAGNSTNARFKIEGIKVKQDGKYSLMLCLAEQQEEIFRICFSVIGNSGI